MVAPSRSAGKGFLRGKIESFNWWAGGDFLERRGFKAVERV